ncbi:hypothetical protein ACWDBC_00495 [Streptomyces parvus]|uniref:hypothetical protein n=1 Tax=Streptomyces TaxID=1883 RepID=UPI00131EE428|nr:hypothetical protein [Streptomyces sp. CS149]
MVWSNAFLLLLEQGVKESHGSIALVGAALVMLSTKVKSVDPLWLGVALLSLALLR